MEKITKGNIYHPCRSCHTPTQNLNNYCDDCQQYACHWQDYQRRLKNAGIKRTYHNKSWTTLRELVMKRDEYLCQECLRHGYLVCGSEVDHIIPIAQGGSDSLDNLQLLCKECHRLKTAKESHQSR